MRLAALPKENLYLSEGRSMCFLHNIKKQTRKGLQRKINNPLKDKRKSITDNFVLFFVATSKGYLLVDNWISFDFFLEENRYTQYRYSEKIIGLEGK